jgi:hypothetical protein
VSKSPRYKFNMRVWHDPLGGHHPCLVCMAGAVMAGSLSADPAKSKHPSNYPLEIERALTAINRFRKGDVEPFLELVCPDGLLTGAEWQKIEEAIEDYGIFGIDSHDVGQDVKINLQHAKNWIKILEDLNL